MPIMPIICCIWGYSVGCVVAICHIVLMSHIITFSYAGLSTQTRVSIPLSAGTEIRLHFVDTLVFCDFLEFHICDAVFF